MITKKILLTGKPGVGKTSISRRFVHGKFSDDYSQSVGSRIDSTELTINNNLLGLRIWDADQGNADLKNLNQQYLNSAAIIYVVDATNPESYSDLEGQLAAFRKLLPYVPVAVALNKSDLASPNDSTVYPAAFGEMIFHTSAKSGEQLDLLFYKLGEELIRRHRQKTTFLNLF